MKISRYDRISNTPKPPEATKGYRYEIFTANKDEFDKYTGRWSDNEQRIDAIRERLLKHEEWDDLLAGAQGTDLLPHLRPGRGGIQANGIVYPYKRDLCGLHISDHKFLASSDILHYSWIDYCYIDRCCFCSKDDVVFTESFFYDSSIQHTRFEACKFLNVSFSFGEFKYCVFSNCHFENFIFNRLPRGVYEYIIFSNCYFKNVDFKNVDLEKFCFSGTCVYENIQINKQAVARYAHPIGKEIIYQLKRWDLESYRERVNTTESIHPGFKRRENRYQSTLDAYMGLAGFYRVIALMEEEGGIYKNYIDWQYWHSWAMGEVKMLRCRWVPELRELVSRYLIGYGAKPLRPIAAWALLNVSFSFLYLLSGIKYMEKPIHRTVGFDKAQLSATLRDLGTCLYYSAITSTTVGYGDVAPLPGFSMLLCSVHAILGLLLTTMFTVIFARRFFK